MTKYTDHKGITTKIEYDEYDEIGWSLLDASTVYRATVTEFSVARGVIAQYTRVVNGDGSEYKPLAYRNYSNGFSPVR